jgi:hypothetical protein
MSWLEDLKAGDKVVISSTYDRRVCIVTRVTKTLIIIGNFRFSKSFGSIVPNDAWSSTYLVPATEKEMQSIRDVKHRNGLLTHLRKTDFSTLQTKTLETIYSIIKEEVTK